MPKSAYKSHIENMLKEPLLFPYINDIYSSFQVSINHYNYRYSAKIITHTDFTFKGVKTGQPSQTLVLPFRSQLPTLVGHHLVTRYFVPLLAPTNLVETPSS